MTTPKSQNPEGKVVAWEYRYQNSFGWSEWASVGSLFDPECDVPEGYEVRGLIPATTITDMQRRLEAAADVVSREMTEELAQIAKALADDGDEHGISGRIWSIRAKLVGVRHSYLLRDGKGDGVSTTEGEWK